MPLRLDHSRTTSMELNNIETGARTAPDENVELDLYSDLSAFILLPPDQQSVETEPALAEQEPEALQESNDLPVIDQAEDFNCEQVVAAPPVEPVSEWFSDASLDAEELSVAAPAVETVEEFFLEPELIEEKAEPALDLESVEATELVIESVEDVVKDFEEVSHKAEAKGEAGAHTFLATGDLLKALNAFSDDLLVSVIGESRGVKCPECGTRCDSEEVFCVSCGGFLNGLETGPKAGYTCDDCWTAIDPGELFCPSCGAIAPN